ncbi:MAG: TetR/AcrR family transcriptional regulator [Negativicutes bacterium]|nr:TetR/AcrR family transcriptional regulator [Negativicutes bacterium]
MLNYHHGQNAEDCRSKRQHILEAAYQVFSRKGYNRATVDEIIALADTGKGTVYNYFVNKEQLFFTLIQERNRPFETALDQVAASDQPPLDKIKAIVRHFLRFYLENGDLWRVLLHEVRGFELGHSVITSETREKYFDIYQRVAGKLEKVIAEGIARGALREYDVTKAAYALFAVILTMVYQKFVDEDVDGTADAITDIFLHGMVLK